MPDNLSIKYLSDLRFATPPKISFSVVQSIFSILSLAGMSTMAIGVTYWIKMQPDWPTWTWIPFALTAFGSVLGGLFELWLLVTGKPFQQFHSKTTRNILSLRLMNLGPVIASSFFFICAMSFAELDFLLVLLYIASGLAVGLAAVLFYGGIHQAANLASVVMLGIQILQILIVLLFSDFTIAIKLLLITGSVLQLLALLTGTAHPLKSTAFHIIATGSGLALFGALLLAHKQSAGFPVSVGIPLAEQLPIFKLLACCLAGIVIAFRVSPKAFNAFRLNITDKIWSFIYFMLIGADRFPMPLNLTKVYADEPPKANNLKPYSITHPKNMDSMLRIPATNDLPLSVTKLEADNKNVVIAAGKSFKLIELLDKIMPQSNSNTPLKNKIRLSLTSSGREYWPKIFQRKLFGMSIPDGGQMEQTPTTAIKRYHEGQLLAYLAESGVASPFLQREEGSNRLMINLRHLERYETKPDFEPYGGKAYFDLGEDDEKPALRLVSLVAPHTSHEVSADPTNAEFRRAERMVTASIYYHVISGKHLAEIHMTYNLVEIALHNAFDVPGHYQHPFRTMLYLHLFAHNLAEELTTEHLVQDGSVFEQIFATTHKALIAHLNDSYARFELGSDEDFEQRLALMTNDQQKVPENACILWEREYDAVWVKYCTAMVQAMYTDDDAVAADPSMQTFAANMKKLLVNGLPKRYNEFSNKAGIIRFAADLIHHCVIRHQVYGTTGIRAALDARIGMVQVPKDGGNYAVEDWRSLAYVATATGRSRFTLLLQEGDDHADGQCLGFRYLFDGVKAVGDSTLDIKDIHRAIDELEVDLRAMDADWKKNPEFNHEYFRPLPSALHTGPGY